MMRPGLVALIGLLLSAPVAADRYYKWKDVDGVTHYTLLPPKGQESTLVNVIGRRPASGASETVTTEVKTTVENTSEPIDPAAAPPKKLAPKAQEMLAAQKASCDNAKVNAATLRSYNQVTLDKDGDGNPETLTPAEHKAELERAETQIATFCEAEKK